MLSPFMNLNTMFLFTMLQWPQSSRHNVTIYDVQSSHKQSYSPPPDLFEVTF
jgi:hypothetical protein